MYTSANELKAQLSKHLSGAMSLAEFDEWFAPVLRDVDKFDEYTLKLTEAVEWVFCDYERGLLSTDQLKLELNALVSNEPQAVMTGYVVVFPSNNHPLFVEYVGGNPARTSVFRPSETVTLGDSLLNSPAGSLHLS
jgi:hypothetical protein